MSVSDVKCLVQRHGCEIVDRVGVNLLDKSFYNYLPKSIWSGFESALGKLAFLERFSVYVIYVCKLRDS